MLEQSLNAMLDFGGAISPCLVGFTGSGKTARIRETAKVRNCNLETLLLGTGLPEDFLGLPRITDSTTDWTIPAWASRAVRTPTLIFLDELDKASPDAWSVVLTLMASREISGIPLHSETRIVYAMQPVEPRMFLATETGKALAARVSFLLAPYDWSWLEKKTGSNLSFLSSPPPPISPLSCPNVN